MQINSICKASDRDSMSYSGQDLNVYKLPVSFAWTGDLEAGITAQSVPAAVPLSWRDRSASFTKVAPTGQTPHIEND